MKVLKWVRSDDCMGLHESQEYEGCQRCWQGWWEKDWTKNKVLSSINWGAFKWCRVHLIISGTVRWHTLQRREDCHIAKENGLYFKNPRIIPRSQCMYGVRTQTVSFIEYWKGNKFFEEKRKRYAKIRSLKTVKNLFEVEHLFLGAQRIRTKGLWCMVSEVPGLNRVRVRELLKSYQMDTCTHCGWNSRRETLSLRIPESFIMGNKHTKLLYWRQTLSWRERHYLNHQRRFIKYS